MGKNDDVKQIESIRPNEVHSRNNVRIYLVWKSNILKKQILLDVNKSLYVKNINIVIS